MQTQKCECTVACCNKKARVAVVRWSWRATGHARSRRTSARASSSPLTRPTSRRARRPSRAATRFARAPARTLSVCASCSCSHSYSLAAFSPLGLRHYCSLICTHAGAAAAEGGVDLNSLMKNPAFMQMANSMMANPQTLSMLQRTFGEALGGAPAGAAAGAGNQPQPDQTATAGTGAPPGPGNMSALLAMGQQLAAQMQASNPELVEQLRGQFRSSSQPHDRPPSSWVTAVVVLQQLVASLVHLLVEQSFRFLAHWYTVFTLDAPNNHLCFNWTLLI